MLARWFGTAQLDHRAVLRLLVPVIVSTAFGTAFFAVTPMLVSPGGLSAISAVSSVEYLNLFLFSVFISLAAGGSVLVAQSHGAAHSHGAADDHQVRVAAGGTVWASVLAAAVLTVALLVFQGPVLSALLGAAGDEVVSLGRVYLIGSVLSYPALAVAESCSAALRGIARSAPALYLTVAMNGGFLLLSAILVRGAGLGVNGLAIAIVVARYAGAILAVWLLRRDDVLGRVPLRRPAWPVVRRVAVIGVPFVAEQLFFNGGKLLIQFFVVGMGTTQITVNAVAQGLVSISEIVAQAMSIAIVPIVGQAIGAGHVADARRIIRSFVVSSTLICCAFAALMLIWFDPLVALFTPSAEIAEDVRFIFAMVIVARLLGFWSLSFLLPSGLRAAGDTIFTTTVATVAMALRVAGIWYVGVHLGHGVVGVWVVQVCEWVLRSVCFVVRYRGSAWTRRSFVAAT